MKSIVAKDLTKLCKTYGVTIKCIGGVVLHSQDEMKKLLGYTSDLDSGPRPWNGDPINNNVDCKTEYYQRYRGSFLNDKFNRMT